MQLELGYDIGDKVKIDGDQSLKGTITAVMVRGINHNTCYEVSYIHCGSSYSVWIESWRITPWAE